MHRVETKNQIRKIASVLLLMFALMTAVLYTPVSANSGTDTDVNVDNGIPVVYLNIDESQGTIESMIDSVDHSVYCYGTISIVVPEGFHYFDFEDLACESLEGLEMSIRGRGNSTWERSPKKPFKIKLDKKTDVLGLGENKHWALLANYFDQTLIRDRITAWLGDKLGFEWTPRGVPVDVVMVGEEYGTHYLGSYYLTENVRVDENRLDIPELKSEDTDPLVITGGYLIQNSYQVRKGSPDRFKTDRGAEWATHTPSFDTEEEGVLGRDLFMSEGEEAFNDVELGDGYDNSAQMEYIQNYIQHFEDVLYEQGTAYRDLMDLESAAKYWLVQMFTLNGDAYATGSTYFYKERDTEDSVGKIYWGPLWDFDFAWDKQLLRDEIPYGHEWMKPMFYDRGEGGFVEEVHKQLALMKEALEKLVEGGGVIDGYRDETRKSAVQDRALHFPDAESSYDDDIENLRQWIIKRMELVDENIGIIDDMIHKVTFIADGNTYRTEYKTQEEHIESLEDYPEKEGYVFIGWTDEEGNIVDPETVINKDMVITAAYLSDKEASHAIDIAFSKNSDIVRYNVHIFMYQIPYTVIPADAIDQKIEWSSSDENYATVDDQGLVSYNGPGTVTLTAKLRFGETRQFTLTVTEDELPVPSAVHPDEDKIRIVLGQQGCFRISTDPDPARIDEYIYSSDDEAVVTVGENGVLTAVGIGETKVHVNTVSYGPDGEEVNLETSVTVVVLKKAPPTKTEMILYILIALLAFAAILALVLFLRIRKRGNRGG